MAKVLRAARRTTSRSEHERRIAYAIIELQNTWCEFARALFLSCAIGGREPNGATVTHRFTSIKTAEDAIAEAVCFFRPWMKGKKLSRRDEPVWHQSITLTRLATHFDFSNRAAILAGLSVSTTFFDDVPPVRNFYAHKNAGTAETVRRIAHRRGIVRLRHPSVLVTAVRRGRPQSIGEDWVSDAISIVEALT